MKKNLVFIVALFHGAGVFASAEPLDDTSTPTQTPLTQDATQEGVTFPSRERSVEDIASEVAKETKSKSVPIQTVNVVVHGELMGLFVRYVAMPDKYKSILEALRQQYGIAGGKLSYHGTPVDPEATVDHMKVPLSLTGPDGKNLVYAPWSPYKPRGDGHK